MSKEENINKLSHISQIDMSIICIIIQCMEALTKEDDKWFTIEEFYNEISLDCVTLIELNFIIPMITYMGTFDSKEIEGVIHYRKDKIVYDHIPSLKRNHVKNSNDLKLRAKANFFILKKS